MPVLLDWIEYNFSICPSKVTPSFAIPSSTGYQASVFPTPNTVFTRLMMLLHESSLVLLDITCCIFGAASLLLDCTVLKQATAVPEKPLACCH